MYLCIKAVCEDKSGSCLKLAPGEMNAKSVLELIMDLDLKNSPGTEQE